MRNWTEGDWSRSVVRGGLRLMSAVVMLWSLVACGGGDSGSGAPAPGAGGTTPPPSGGSLPAVVITSPTSNASLPIGPVVVAFTASNFTVGGAGQSFARLLLDADPVPYEVFNAPTNQVRYQGATTAQAEWIGPNQVRFPALPQGQHQVHVELVEANGTRVGNAGAQAATAFAVGVPAVSAAAIIPDQPAEGSVQARGTIPVSFIVLNHTIGLPGQPHLQFRINDEPTPHQFYNGVGITDENGVLLNGKHDHAVHWKSPTSFDMYGAWPAGEYTLRFELVDAQNQPLANPEATATRRFTIVEAPHGEARLQTMIEDMPTIAMAFAPDGRLFVSEGKSGNISIVDTAGGTWQKRATPFYHVDVAQAVEQGTFGIALDPAFASNGYVYLYYTAADGSKNRVIRLKDVAGVGTQPTTVLDNIPAAEIHNGGIIRFGADGKLYIATGEITQDALAQDRSSLGGKILRINGDGSIPADNPIAGSPVYALGWRNGFGLAVHPITKDLWGTENGPDTDDEVNRIVAGGNYGWPNARGITGNPALVDPIYSLNPTVGITGIVAVAATPVYPAAYHNTLLFTNVNNGDIRRLTLGHGYRELEGADVILGGAGPLVDLQQGPDGYVYASGFSTIYRVVVDSPTP